MPRQSILTCICVLVIGVLSACARAGDNESLADQTRRAAAYLDSRQDAWTRFGPAQHGEGATRTSCVSCHTTMPYVLSRSLIGKAAGETSQPSRLQRLVKEVSLRTEHWSELENPKFKLLFDFDERKKVESRGTEAVLNTLVLALDDAASGRKEPSEKSRLAFRTLWATQLTKGENAGSWDWFNFGEEPWEAEDSPAFGAALAAIAVASAPGYQAGSRDESEKHGMDLLESYLRRRFPGENLYNRIWILHASTFWKGLLKPEEQREVVKRIAAKQHADGGWALAPIGNYERIDGTAEPTESDGYATGLICHVLLRSGESSSPLLEKGLAWLRSNQRPDGSWPASSMNKNHDPKSTPGKFMTDAGTAFAALALVEAEKR